MDGLYEEVLCLAHTKVGVAGFFVQVTFSLRVGGQPSPGVS